MSRAHSVQAAAAAVRVRCNTTLFVDGLPESFASGDLTALFAPYGQLVEGEVFFDDDNVSRGFGFVTMFGTDAAARAKAELNLQTLPGISPVRPLKVRWALDKATLFVGDLGPDVTGDQLQEAFQQFGDVVSCRLEREPRERGGRSKGYGFVEYDRRGVAAKVQQLLTDNLLLLGSSPRPVHVEFALDEGGADGAPVDPSLALQPPPHFAQPGTLEFDFALRWRELTLSQKAEGARLAELHSVEQETMRQEQRDEYLRERSKLKRLEELAQGYVPPSAETAQSSAEAFAAAKRQRPE